MLNTIYDHVNVIDGVIFAIFTDYGARTRVCLRHGFQMTDRAVTNPMK